MEVPPAKQHADIGGTYDVKRPRTIPRRMPNPLPAAAGRSDQGPADINRDCNRREQSSSRLSPVKPHAHFTVKFLSVDLLEDALPGRVHRDTLAITGGTGATSQRPLVMAASWYQLC